MASDGVIKGLSAQRPYDQGVTEAMLAGYGLLGKAAPAYVALPALPVTKANLADAWTAGLPQARHRQDQEEHVTRPFSRIAGEGADSADEGKHGTRDSPPPLGRSEPPSPASREKAPPPFEAPS